MLWRVHALRRFSFLINVVILCGTNNLYQDSLEDIENDLIIIASCFKQGSNSMNVFICGILPRDDIVDKSSAYKRIKEHFKIIMLLKPY